MYHDFPKPILLAHSMQWENALYLELNNLGRNHGSAYYLRDFKKFLLWSSVGLIHKARILIGFIGLWKFKATMYLEEFAQHLVHSKLAVKVNDCSFFFSLLLLFLLLIWSQVPQLFESIKLGCEISIQFSVRWSQIVNTK